LVAVICECLRAQGLHSPGGRLGQGPGDGRHLQEPGLRSGQDSRY
jgi:hypothetical protein